MIWSLRRYLVELVLLANAVAFSVLLAELAILGHSDGIQRVAPVAASTGVVLSLAALFLRGPARYATAAAFVVLSAAGLIGVAQHLGESGDDDDESEQAQVRSRADEDDDEEDGDEEDDDDDPPLLAPLALSGSAMLGVLASLAGVPGRDETRRERRL